MLKINYTQELIDEIKKVYPDNTLLHDLVEEGEESIGRMLLDLIPKDPTYDELLAIETFEEFQALKNHAKQAKIKDALYEKWIREMHAAYLNDIQSTPIVKRKLMYNLIEEDK
ncbi:MAG: hypothetical protein WC333_01930 [Dehalococcoidia bacterium]|jgi:hypothetical protein